MNVATLTAWRQRRTSPLVFRLESTTPGTGRPAARTFTVPDHPARVWVYGVLAEESADLLLDALPAADAELLWDEACDEDSDITTDLLHTIGQAVLERVADRPWWQAERLVHALVANWQALDGLAADRGLGDPLDWPLERLCNWVYLRLLKGAANDDERDRLEMDLATPPTGLAVEDVEVDEGSGWASLAGAFGVAGPDGTARIGVA